LANVVAAGVGGGIFGGAVRAASEGFGAAVSAIQRRRLEQEQARVARRQQSLAEQAQPLSQERIDTDPALKSAVNTIRRDEEIRQQDPFPPEVPGAGETFQRAFDAVLHSAQKRGEFRAVQTNLPTREALGAVEIDTDEILGAVAAAAKRTAGADGDTGTRAASALATALRGRVQQRTSREELDRVRNVVGRVVDGAEDPTELGRAIKTGGQLAELADEVGRRAARAEQPDANKGHKAAATKARNNFFKRFRQEFPDAAEGEAEKFLAGNSDLAQAVETIRRAGIAGDQSNPARLGSGLLDLGPEQIVATLRQFSRPLQEEVASERHMTALGRRTAETERLLEGQDEQIARMRTFVVDDINPNQRIVTTDEDGNEFTTTARDLLNDLDEDEKVVNEINDCLGGTR
jgi:hypothetical protein